MEYIRIQNSCLHPNDHGQAAEMVQKCSAIASRELIARTDWKNAIFDDTERDDADADVEQWC